MDQIVVRACALAKALAHGLAKPAEVVAWVDSVIAETEDPDYWLIEASLAGHDVNGLITALQEEFDQRVGGEGADVWRAVLGHFGDWFATHPSDGPLVAQVIYDMAVAGQVPDRSAETEMFSFDDAYEHAVAGHWGSVEQLDAELAAFLEPFRL